MKSLREQARRNGIEAEYTSETGERRAVPDATLRAILEILAGAEEGGTPPPRTALPGPAKCFTPAWFARERCWGFTCQLYGLRSRRNWGIGDFEDLAVLAENAAACGADFIGLNPVHALFLEEPDRSSPYSPSSRRFLNPLYIAPDRLPESDAFADSADAGALAGLRAAELVDYRAVARVKLAALARAFARAREDAGGWSDFTAYRKAEGDALRIFALHEAIAEHVAHERSAAAGWPGWPKALRDPAGPAVARFAEAHAERVDFHAWLQWLAARQLAEAQARARRAGMRIGLYTDLAVGVAGDGAATWAARGLVVADARIGAPPDYFNADGQDWGLAPFSPAALARRGMAPLREDFRAAMTAAGAMRLDHAMVLSRLYWIPGSATAHGGAYVRYPFDAMIGTLAEESRRSRCIVIGEALGTVEPDFRKRLAEADVLSYQLLFFERRKDGSFRRPRAWSRKALACISTHDLATLAGWWSGRDLMRREESGFLPSEQGPAQRAEREKDKRRLAEALRASGEWSGEVPHEMSAALSGAVHRFVARTPARVFAVQLEDALGLEEQANLPGPEIRHPNWRRRLPVPVDELMSHDHLRSVVEAVVRERRGTRARD